MEVNIQASQERDEQADFSIGYFSFRIKERERDASLTDSGNPKASFCSLTVMSRKRAKSSAGRNGVDSVPEVSAVSTLNIVVVSYTAGSFNPGTAGRHLSAKSAKPRQEDYRYRPPEDTGITSHIKDDCGRLTTLVSQVSLNESSQDYYGERDWDQTFAIPGQRWKREWTSEVSDPYLDSRKKWRS